MKILIFNWRDRKNPKSGGAEQYTEEIAQRLVDKGHEVTLFTTAFAGSLAEENVRGLKIIRKGKQWTVHFWAWRYYKKHFKGKFDVVIDEINTIPFFTPVYAKEKKVMYINQLAREVWFYEAPFPLSFIGYIFESLYLKIYRKTLVITISDSTKNDLVKLGFDEHNIKIVTVGLDLVPLMKIPPRKEEIPTLIYFGSIRPMKRVTEISKAFSYIVKEIPNSRLWIVGSGDRSYISKVKTIIRKNNLENKVKFWGSVSKNKKAELLERAHILFCTSVREGWGLVVSEANAMGTPAVVYDVPGLCDSTIDGETGIVCNLNEPKELASNVISLLGDEQKYANMQEQGWQQSKELNWDKTAEEFLQVLENVIG